LYSSEQVTGYREYDSEASSFVRGRGFLDWLISHEGTCSTDLVTYLIGWNRKSTNEFVFQQDRQNT